MQSDLYKYMNDYTVEYSSGATQTTRNAYFRLFIEGDEIARQMTVHN